MVESRPVKLERFPLNARQPKHWGARAWLVLSFLGDAGIGLIGFTIGIAVHFLLRGVPWGFAAGFAAFLLAMCLGIKEGAVGVVLAIGVVVALLVGGIGVWREFESPFKVLAGIINQLIVVLFDDGEKFDAISRSTIWSTQEFLVNTGVVAGAFYLLFVFAGLPFYPSVRAVGVVTKTGHYEEGVSRQADGDGAVEYDAWEYLEVDAEVRSASGRELSATERYSTNIDGLTCWDLTQSHVILRKTSVPAVGSSVSLECSWNSHFYILVPAPIWECRRLCS